ncbi:MAG: NAD(P)/FAD-dependent oxidoreductase [Bacteroidota bacterium]
MEDNNAFEVLIIGGSYAGLSAALALGRSLRKVLIIDSGTPCNRQTPHAHNLITHDGKRPDEIRDLAKTQVAAYDTVQFYSGLATNASKIANGFEVHTASQQVFKAQKLVLATGVKDIMPDIEGFAACWGISVIHCPYCHGYEVRGEKTGIIGNGEFGFEFSKMILHWTKDLSLFTNGASTLKEEETQQLQAHGVNIIEKGIQQIEHEKGSLQNIVFQDGSRFPVKAVYAKTPFVQHTDIAVELGCEMTEEGYISVDQLQKTTTPGVFACGDSTTRFRSVAHAIAMGNIAGAMLNHELIMEAF